MRVVFDGWLFTWVRGSGVRWAVQCLRGWPPSGGTDSAVLLVPREGAQHVPADLPPAIEVVTGEPQADSYLGRRAEWDQRVVPALLERVRGDVLYNAAMTLPLVTAVPGCTVVHDLYFLEDPTGRSSGFYRDQVAPSLARAVRVCTPSALVARQLSSRLGVPAGKVRVTAPDIGDAFHPRDAAGVRHDLAALGLAPGYVLFVGDLIPRKRVPFLLEAMAEPCLGGSPVVLVGGGRQPSADIAEAVSRLPAGSVRFLPWVDDPVLASLYSGAAVTALPAVWEGFCYPAFESAACGTPAVVDRGTPAAESGFPGIVPTDTGDPAAFAAAVAAARGTRVDGARQSWPRLAESTWDVLRECLV